MNLLPLVLQIIFSFLRYEVRTDSGGRVYYVDHTRRITSWEPPLPEQPLPTG